MCGYLLVNLVESTLCTTGPRHVHHMTNTKKRLTFIFALSLLDSFLRNCCGLFRTVSSLQYSKGTFLNQEKILRAKRIEKILHKDKWENGH